MEVELWSGGAKAIIDPRGAWVTNLSDDRGDVLFPKRKLKTASGEAKIRGGCHVCLPNFGPGGNSGQPQHGFGRLMDWEIVDQAASRLVLRLIGGGQGYETLRSTLTYTLGDAAIEIELEVENTGESNLRVAPAFHPYFAVLGREDVKIDGEIQPLEDLADTLFVTGDTQSVELPLRKLTLSSRQLPVWAKWTDQLGAYVCVEPTVGGYTFLESTPNEAELLGPAQARNYALTIAWR